MLRRAEERDLDQIMALLVQVDMVHHRGRPDLFKGPATKYTKEELKEIIADDNTPVFVFSSEDDGRILGHAFTMIEEHPKNHVLTDIRTLCIDDICVDEAEREHHVGQQLYEYVENYARECDCYNVTLNVWECNPGAKAFYEHLGLVPQKTGMEKIIGRAVGNT